ncbi:hypothetical protein IWX65_003646, partial [Arthrobacter sp. CAN_A214]
SGAAGPRCQLAPLRSRPRCRPGAAPCVGCGFVLSPSGVFGRGAMARPGVALPLSSRPRPLRLFGDPLPRCGLVALAGVGGSGWLLIVGLARRGLCPGAGGLLRSGVLAVSSFRISVVWCQEMGRRDAACGCTRTCGALCGCVWDWGCSCVWVAGGVVGGSTGSRGGAVWGGFLFGRWGVEGNLAAGCPGGLPARCGSSIPRPRSRPLDLGAVFRCRPCSRWCLSGLVRSGAGGVF